MLRKGGKKGRQEEGRQEEGCDEVLQEAVVFSENKNLRLLGSSSFTCLCVKLWQKTAAILNLFLNSS